MSEAGNGKAQGIRGLTDAGRMSEILISRERSSKGGSVYPAPEACSWAEQ